MAVVVALVAVVAVVAIGVVAMASGPAPAASPSITDAPTDDTGALPTDDQGVAGSVIPASPILEGLMPTTVAGNTMTVQSTNDATSLSAGPDARALNAAVVNLGKQPADLEIAYAYDESGTIDLTILGFRADGISGADMRTAVMSAWLAAGTPGVTTTTLSWSGAEVSKVSYGDDVGDEYVLTVGDSVFVLETTDATAAQSAVEAIVAAGGAAPSAAPSTTTPEASAEPSPAAS